MIGVKKLDYFVVPVLWTFLDLDKFLDLNLYIFRIFDLNKILTILFSLFLIILYLLLFILFFSTISNNTSKNFINFIKNILSTKVNSLVILIKLLIKHQYKLVKSRKTWISYTNFSLG